MAFTSKGIGYVLADSLNREIDARGPSRPPEERGHTLLIATDSSGSHQRQLFETYSFLLLDIDRNAEWLSGQCYFRERILPRRRMAYKSLGDRIRRDALLPFLDLGHIIDGWMVTFAVSKNGLSLFESAGAEVDPDNAEALTLWKDPVRERLLRVLHFSAFLLSGLSIEGQDLLWITDEDEIAANDAQLTALTKLFGNIISNSISHSLRHIRCATARSDDGSLSIEDLLAYPDLASGAVCDVTTAMKGQHDRLQSHVLAPLPRNISWKSQTIIPWLGATTGALQRLTYLIDIHGSRPALSTKLLRWHVLPGQILRAGGRS